MAAFLLFSSSLVLNSQQIGIQSSRKNNSDNGKADLHQPQLYLLAGTSTRQSDESFPVTLYQITPEKKLNAVREVVSSKDGLHSIITHTGELFVAYPHGAPTTLSIIHTSDPKLVDEVIFNASASHVFVSGLSIVETAESSVFWLVQVLKDTADIQSDYLVSVAAKSEKSVSRVKLNQWDLYNSMRLNGHTGGPIPLPDGDKQGKILDDKIIFPFKKDHYAEIDKVAPFFTSNDKKRIPVILIATKEYLVYCFQFTDEEYAKDKISDRSFSKIYVHDRIRNTWKIMQIPGSNPVSRIFGKWLTSTVEMNNPNHKPSLGIENQRDYDTETLPNVKSYFHAFRLRNFWLPGRLTLQNLEDDRSITIETGQADSEVLYVDGDRLLYRVNDQIFQGTIVKDQIKNISLLVQDDDVPEIHWVFWSK